MHEIADFFADLAAFSDERDYLSSSSDEDNARHKKQQRHRRKSRLVPFYQTRKDVLTYFEDDRIFRTFHSDRESIQYITGMLFILSTTYLHYYYSVLHLFVQGWSPRCSQKVKPKLSVTWNHWTWSSFLYSIMQLELSKPQWETFYATASHQSHVQLLLFHFHCHFFPSNSSNSPKI